VTSNPTGGVDSKAGTTSLSHRITGLINGTAYTFTVTATNADGTSMPSASSVSVTPVTVPGVPVIGTATAGNTQATVTFTAPVSDGGSAITGYTVISSPAGGVDSNAGTTSLNHVITGLTNGKSYTFTVKASNAAGTSAASTASNRVVPALTVPAAPVIGVATGGNAQATVVFSAPASNGGSIITGYTVTSNPAGGVDSNAGTTNLVHVITGLANGTSYSFTVKAINAVGTSAASAASNSVMINTGVLQVYYIHADQLDTPREITDTGGNVVWQWDNIDPFGNNVPNENPSGLGTFRFDLRFPGQVADRETNTFYNTYRDAYDPALDRYTQSDPIGLAGGINTYTYVLGNPISRIDPTGLDVYVVNTDAVGGLHQKIVVDTPNGQYGQSFGMSSRDLPQQGLWEAYQGHQQPGLPSSGVIYSDSDPITKIQRRFETTQQEDALIETYLKFQRDWTGSYNVASNSCRDYSNRQYDMIVNAIQNLRAGKK
jgi:RHS repeat-associated protein